MPASERYEFGPFALDAAERRLARRDRPIPLPPKTFDVLLALLRHAGQLMTKRELLQAVWPGTFVEEGILAVHVSRLRKALRDGSERSCPIETVSRIGYRFRAAASARAAGVGDQSSVCRSDCNADPATIAVLPFTNIGGDVADEYFSDGLTEEIIHTLTHIPGLKVIARTSSFAFTNTRTDIREIARTLGVASVLEGSVRRAEGRIRITAQLIRAADGTHLWSGRYERDMQGIFALQDEIAQAIMSALHVRLSAALTLRRHAPTLTAYDAYLKALYHHRKFTPISFARSKEHYEQAIALDPEFAEARSALGRYFFALVLAGVYPARDGVLRVRTAARQALRIDPSLPDAHALLGLIAATCDYVLSYAVRDRDRCGRVRRGPGHLRDLRVAVDVR